MSKLVIVESPAKATTIQKYLPEGFVVRACVGHVRDLPKGELGVDIDADFEPTYVEKPDKEEAHNALRRALAEASEVYLATDEDREGEAIAWHLIELFDIDLPVHRMVFNEITPEAIRRGLENTRELDTNLVAAQEARRTLDRIVGYPVSELVGRKVLWQLSTGRVQGAALHMVVEQERERRRFKSGLYWDLVASLCAGGVEFDADLKSIEGQRVASGADFDKYTGKLIQGCDAVLLDGETAGQLAAGAEESQWKVSSVWERSRDYSPKAPFTTASLQREASSQLGFSASRTMALAQQLYEAGLLTYVRTDSTRLSEQAVQAAREAARGLYGEENVAAEPRSYATKSKGAQDAHEAIRPANERFRHPAEIDAEDDQRRLYELIWKRTVASQMADATVTYRRVDIEAQIQGSCLLFGAGDKRLDFAGFRLALVEGAADPRKALAEQFGAGLPEFEAGESLACQSLTRVRLRPDLLKHPVIGGVCERNRPDNVV
jgi:DNA topoisomerase-1